MKTSQHVSVNLLGLLFAFMVLCPGQNAHSASVPTQAKAQLHTPWNLLSERLRAIINQRASNGSVGSTPIENRLISVPYDGATLDWNLTGGSIAAGVKVSSASMSPVAASVTASQATVHVVLNQLTLDQVIEKNVGGVTVRVHLNAVCGPIAMDQLNASAAAVFALAWPNASPTAALSSLDLRWAAGIWTFSNFTCTGPSGLDQLVRDGLADFLKEPSSLKPFVESYISANLQSAIDATLARLRTPFVLTKKDPITLTVGALEPSATGVVADLTFQTSSKEAPRAPLPLPSDSVLGSLSTSQPSIVGDLSVLEFVVASRLNAQPQYLRVDLQTIDAFHKLMHSRLEQLFVWQDLWHYPSDNPFYLNFANPRALDLKHSGTSMSLSSSIPLYTTIQSHRDDQWWNYVESKGTAATTVALSLANGTLTYATAINTLSIASAYSSAYRAQYNKKNEKLPDSVVEKAIKGPQALLSGAYQLPLIDLQEAGAYRASTLKWATPSTFTLNFAAVN